MLWQCASRCKKAQQTWCYSRVPNVTIRVRFGWHHQVLTLEPVLQFADSWSGLINYNSCSCCCLCCTCSAAGDQEAHQLAWHEVSWPGAWTWPRILRPRPTQGQRVRLWLWLRVCIPSKCCTCQASACHLAGCSCCRLTSTDAAYDVQISLLVDCSLFELIE